MNVENLYIKTGKLNELLRYSAEYWELEDCTLSDRKENALGGWEYSSSIIDKVVNRKYGFERLESLYQLGYLVFDIGAISKYKNSELDGYNLGRLMFEYNESLFSKCDYRFIPIDQELLDILADRGWIFTKPSPKTTQPDTAQTEPTQENKTMSNIKTAVTATANTQKDAAILAAKIAVGGTANNMVAKMVKPKVGMLVGGHVNTPIGKLVIANLTQYAVNQFASNNEKAKVISEAMVQAATIEMLGQLDLEGIISDITDKISGNKVDQLLDEDKKIVID